MGKGVSEVTSPRRSLQEGASLVRDRDEERTGLLSADERTFEDDTQVPLRPNRTRKYVVGISVGFIVILLGALFGRPLLHSVWPRPKQKPDFDNGLLRSNGTHYFKKSALIVSIDGLRCVLLDLLDLLPAYMFSERIILTEGLLPTYWLSLRRACVRRL